MVKINDSELRFLNLLWEYEPVNSTELVRLCEKHLGWKKSTTYTVIRRLAARLEIPMDHVYCVGDEANDITMLRAAAQGFAPANCVDAVRACGATLVADCRHDALAEVVDILDQRYR